MHAPGHDPRYGKPSGRKQSYRDDKPEPAAQQPPKTEDGVTSDREDPAIGEARKDEASALDEDELWKQWHQLE